MKNRYLFLSVLLSLLAGSISAQAFTSIDILQGSGNGNPSQFTEFNGKVYFNAIGDTTKGYELWVTDGTPGGSSMVADIWQGRGSSQPNSFVPVGNKLFFTANDSIHGQELWVTDGTPGGTSMVLDIYPGSTGAGVAFMTALNGKLYFAATDGPHGSELWVSDGTAGGTSLVKDIYAGNSSSNIFGVILNANGGSFYTYHMTAFNGKLYFRADDGIHGVELWSTDGTTGGTTMVSDMWAGPGAGNPYCITQLGNKLIMSAADSLHGFELWVSDGTNAGTALIKDIEPGMQSGYPSNYSDFREYNGKLYFNVITSAYGVELWSTDGTSAGTTLVKDILAGPGGSNAGNYGPWVYNGRLYFSANDSINGNQLWSSDGTTAGTTLFKVLSPYTPANASPYLFTNYNNKMYFIASTDSINLAQLYVSDGTSGGTHVIAPAISPNYNPMAYTYNLVPTANGLYMQGGFNSIGYELWIYNTPTAITETSGEGTLSAYPNPFGNSITLSGLQSSELYTLSVYDMTGRECYQYELNNPAASANVSMPDLATGVYLMRVSTQGSSQTFRLVKN